MKYNANLFLCINKYCINRCNLFFFCNSVLLPGCKTFTIKSFLFNLTDQLPYFKAPDLHKTAQNTGFKNKLDEM